MKGYVYILKCANGSYYTGSTTDLEKRIAQHKKGEGAKFTKSHLPVELVYTEEFSRIDDAFYRERQIHGWSKKKKEALIKGDFDRLHELAECKNETAFFGSVRLRSPTEVDGKGKKEERMKKDWQIKNFEDCLEPVKYTAKIQSKDYKETGTFPIISQEEELISGYWNEENDVFKLVKPVVIFGDHTRVLKYIDFDFVLGADGVKILQPKDFLNAKYFLYFLKNADIKNLGYARHFRLLKELQIPVPPLDEQERIVKILDQKFAQIETFKTTAQKNLQNAKDLFQAELEKAFSNDTWEKKRLGDVAIEFSRGKSKHRPRNDKCLFNGEYPFIQTGDIRNTDKYITSFSVTYNETGLAQSKLWPKGTLCITIAANIAETAILTFPCCFPDSVIGFIPNEKNTSVDFIYYVIQFFKEELQKLSKGAAQDNLNLAKLETMCFPLPPLDEQKRIVAHLDALQEKVRQLEEIYTKQIADCDELKQAFLQKAFAGEL